MIRFNFASLDHHANLSYLPYMAYSSTWALGFFHGSAIRARDGSYVTFGHKKIRTWLEGPYVDEHFLRAATLITNTTYRFYAYICACACFLKTYSTTMAVDRRQRSAAICHRKPTMGTASLLTAASPNSSEGGVVSDIVPQKQQQKRRQQQSNTHSMVFYASAAWSLSRSC